MKPYLLLVVALLLFIICAPACLLTTLLRSIIRWKRVSFFAYTGESALSLALSIDLMGNVIGRDLLELTMTQHKPDRYRFGTYNETISAALGHNKALGTLTGLGKALAGLLNLIDPGHVERAAKLPIPSPHPLAVLVRSYLRRYWVWLGALLSPIILRIVLSVAGLLLLIATSSTAQVQPFDIPIFRGEPKEKILLLSLADSARSVSAQTFWDRGGRLLPAELQPTLIRSAKPGTVLAVRLENTLNLPLSGGWIEIRVGGQLRAAGRLILTQLRSPATPPIDAPSGVGEGTVKFWRLNSAVSGQEIRHGSNSRLVTGQFFRDDTGQIDPLVRIEIIDENRVRLIAPPGETISGQLTTIIIQKLTQ